MALTFKVKLKLKLFFKNESAYIPGVCFDLCSYLVKTGGGCGIRVCVCEWVNVYRYYPLPFQSVIIVLTAWTFFINTTGQMKETANASSVLPTIFNGK